jgi:hypothetical protein
MFSVSPEAKSRISVKISPQIQASIVASEFSIVGRRSGMRRRRKAARILSGERDRGRSSGRSCGPDYGKSRDAFGGGFGVLWIRPPLRWSSRSSLDQESTIGQTHHGEAPATAIVRAVRPHLSDAGSYIFTEVAGSGYSVRPVEVGTYLYVQVWLIAFFYTGGCDSLAFMSKIAK